MTPESILSRVRVAESGCWEWTGARYKSGYGYISGPKRVYAHRASCAILKGQSVEGLVVMHKCDNPSCVNPDHLQADTQAANLKDARDKGRMKPG